MPILQNTVVKAACTLTFTACNQGSQYDAESAPQLLVCYTGQQLLHVASPAAASCCISPTLVAGSHTCDCSLNAHSKTIPTSRLYCTYRLRFAHLARLL